MIKIISPWFIKTFRPKGVNATTFLPFVVIFKDAETARHPVICRHEAIHGRQMIECLLIGSMILVWWWNFFGKKPNPFEQEAYKNQYNLYYLKKRKLYAWRKYLK